jgi:hypothetical protein
MILQMAVKSVNNIAGPDGLVPTLLVFGVYLRMTLIDTPSLAIAKRAEAICTAMAEVRRLYASRQVKEALAIKNRPDTTCTLDLLL